MSDPAPTTPPAPATGADPAPTDPPASTDPKPTETVDFWKAKAREQERRAKDNADAAKRLAEIEEAQKSEAQKAADRIAELERQNAATAADALRFKVASEYEGKISKDDVELFLTGNDEETLRKQADALANRTPAATSPSTPMPDLTQGGNPAAGSTPESDFATFMSGQLS